MSDRKNKASGTDAPSPRLTLAGRLRAYFFAGILLTAPISITIYIAWMFIDFVDRQVTPLLPADIDAKLWGVRGIPGIGLLLVVVFLTLVGALTAGFVGRIWVRLTEAVMRRTPVLRGLYSAIKQIFETVLAQKSQAFREVALIEYPRRGIWTIAFITGRTTGVIRDQAGEELINVFVPTTPNPTSGFLLFLPATDVRRLPMTVEDGLKLVISGGIVAPPEDQGAKEWETLPLA
ncbi:MAG: DUF502 domain-containing protein [Telmatospirillum sp.]|nr:DUF502 domain-containing protein [Telmatospirillum sp.]